MATQNIFANGNEIRRFATYEAAVKHAEKVNESHPDLHARFVIVAAPDEDFFPVFVGNDTLELLHSGYAVTN